MYTIVLVLHSSTFKINSALGIKSAYFELSMVFTCLVLKNHGTFKTSHNSSYEGVVTLKWSCGKLALYPHCYSFILNQMSRNTGPNDFFSFVTVQSITDWIWIASHQTRKTNQQMKSKIPQRVKWLIPHLSFISSFSNMKNWSNSHWICFDSLSTLLLYGYWQYTVGVIKKQKQTGIYFNQHYRLMWSCSLWTPQLQ